MNLGPAAFLLNANNKAAAQSKIQSKEMFQLTLILAVARKHHEPQKERFRDRLNMDGRPQRDKRLPQFTL